MTQAPQSHPLCFRVLLFATNPCYRWQNIGEFRMLFNAILNYKFSPAASAPPSKSESAY